MMTKENNGIRKAMLVSGLALLFACSANRQPLANDPPTVAKHVDLDRYLGKWYEIARYPNRFQKTCVASTAVYSSRTKVSVDPQPNSPDGDRCL